MNKKQTQLQVNFALAKEELKDRWLNNQITTEEYLREKSVLESEFEYEKLLKINH